MKNEPPHKTRGQMAKRMQTSRRLVATSRKWEGEGRGRGRGSAHIT